MPRVKVTRNLFIPASGYMVGNSRTLLAPKAYPPVHGTNPAPDGIYEVNERQAAFALAHGATLVEEDD